MYRRTCILATTALLTTGLVAPALAGRPSTSDRYDGVATIRSATGDLLLSDGRGDYEHPHGNVFAVDRADPESDDRFALYVGARRTFSISFGSPAQTHVCGGVSHVFFDSPGWWDATAKQGDVALGSVSVWCDQGDDSAYAVRFPGNPLRPATDGKDCNVAERLADVDGGRSYRFATPAAEAAEPGLLPLPGLEGDDPASACAAEVFHVTDVKSSNRQEEHIATSDAPLEITAVLH